MKYRKILLGICIVVPLLLLAGILWRDSEQQYVAMTNLGLRLKMLQQVELAGSQFSQKNWPSWEMAWKPMITAMQFEAKQAAMRKRGFHLSQTMYEQLLRFSEEKISDETDLKKLLSQLNFSDQVIAATAPLVFSVNEQEYSLSTVARFHNEASAVLSSEIAYSDWVSPILQQQRSLDRATTCKTLMEIKAFQLYTDRLKSKCATETDKWTVCSGKDEPVARQMQELQASLESNLKKFKSRWPVENVNDLCSDF
ncbi:MAG TPA: hypothetical protein VIU93_10150 [Gallionellaceae bacterium]